MKRLKPHLTYANVVATLALIVAVSGGATAIAITASKNSVTTKSIRADAVRAKNLGPTIVRSASDPNNTGSTVAAKCQTGERALGGGGAVALGQSLAVSGPNKDTWYVLANPPFPKPVTAFVLCLRR